MFDSIIVGQIVRLHFSGSTQGLAMRVRYEGTDISGDRLFSGLGLMADARPRVRRQGDQWLLGTGRVVTKVEAV